MVSCTVIKYISKDLHDLRKCINKGIKKFYFSSFSEIGIYDPDNIMCSSEVGLLIFSMPCWGKAEWQSSKGSCDRPKRWVSFTEHLKRNKYILINWVLGMGHFSLASHVFSRRQEGTHLSWGAVCPWLRIILQVVLISTEKWVKSHPSGNKDYTSFTEKPETKNPKVWPVLIKI